MLGFTRLIGRRCSVASSIMQRPVLGEGGVQHCAAIRGFASKKHKRVLKMAKGFRGRANRCYRPAIDRLEKSFQYAYRDRKVKRREWRKLWIQRIGAGVRQYGSSYSRFVKSLNESPVKLNRKVLANLCANEPFSFKAAFDVIQKTTKAKAAAAAPK